MLAFGICVLCHATVILYKTLEKGDFRHPGNKKRMTGIALTQEEGQYYRDS